MLRRRPPRPRARPAGHRLRRPARGPLPGPGTGRRAAGLRQAADRPLQVPAGRPVRDRAPPQLDRQGPALRAPPPGLVRIAVVGGGPGGLYFSALARQLDPAAEITVWERNAADDTFGFGVVFSDETLGGIEHADSTIYAAMEREFARWDDIDVHFRGQVHTSGGHGFAAMSRKRLLQILQQRCAELGVTVHFSALAPDPGELRKSHDLVIAADGANSMVRTRYADVFGPTLESRRCRYMWLGTDKVFDAFKFYIAETPHGVMQIHGYPYDAGNSTFIVEMTEQVWERAGFAAVANQAFQPGESDEKSVGLIRDLFPDVLGGAELFLNNSKWLRF